MIFLARCVMVQNRKRIVNALTRADIAFTIAATFETFPPAKRVKNRAITINTGLPGGCPTSSLKADAIIHHSPIDLL